MKFSDIIMKRREVLIKEKLYKPLSEIKEDIKRVKLRKNFKNSLLKEDDVSIICEYKPASPSAGKISNLTVETVLPLFEKSSASAASIITEECYFKSNINNLKIACKISCLSLLRKDFILDEYQIYESRANGANAVLLMADIYPNLSEGILITNYLGMDAVVECKNREEVDNAVKAGAEIIGINNRCFDDFSIDFKRTRELSRFVPPEIILVSESGVKNADDVKLLSSYGVDALLVGTSIMSSNEISGKIVEIVSAAENSRMERR
jgi:indole-3-glycerol phosphate synthase